MSRSPLSRRDVLKRIAAGFACISVPLRLAYAESAVSKEMEILSAYMAAASTRELPKEVLEQAQFHILDTFAAMISGSQLGPGRVAIRFARANTSAKGATVIASDSMCSTVDSAFVNGMLAHSDESDDYAPIGSHPGCAVVPAAFAAGEQFAIDGPRFIRSVALGYDLANRVAAALGGQSFLFESHKSIHTASGTFGAAAAAGCAAGLDARQMRWLLDYAAQQSSGIAAWQRDTEHIEKAFVFAGMPARNGAVAALLVQMGATGVDDILSGKDNYLLAYSPAPNPAIFVAQLGDRYEITRTTIKKWTVGGPIQAALDALEALLKRQSCSADQVQQVVVKLGPRMGTVVDNREIPDICVQHMLAVMLLDKTVSFQAAHDVPRMKDPAVLKQRAKVSLQFDPALEPDTEARQAIVEITLTDGVVLSEHIKAVRGTPDNPMTRAEVIAKSRDLIAPVLGSSTCEKLIDRLLNLRTVQELRDLRPLLQINGNA